MKIVCILDYGSGNVRSVKNTLELLDIECVVSNDSNAVRNSSHIILPGVGAFGTAMERIKRLLPLKVIEKQIFKHQKPFLGICVGMQVLAEKGYEFGMHKGLGWLDNSEVIENTKLVRQPHIGWNSVSITNSSPILYNIENNSDFYFVHSYIMTFSSRNHIIGETDYGNRFPSIVGKNNIYGVQFHPEKSQGNGTQILRNFCNLQ